MRILILATDIYTRGGIARYTATLAASLGQLLGAQNVDLLPLLDDREHRFIPDDYRILKATATKLTLSQKVRHLARALKCSRGRYDLVFCSLVGLAPIASLIRRWRGTPYLVVCYGSEVWDRLPLVKRAALEGASLVLADSRFTADVLADTNGIPKSKIRLLLNAIPDDLVRRLVGPDPDTPTQDEASARPREFGRYKTERSIRLNGETTLCSPMSFLAQREIAPRAGDNGQATFLASLRSARNDAVLRRPTRPDGPVLLSVGSLSSEHTYKGVDTVIEALPCILEAVPGARYRVVGDGDNRSNLERLAARRGVAGQVTFAGEVTDAELAEHYRACDVFVLPSRASRGRDRRNGRSEGEGFGRVYVEAALAGKPVVGSRDGGAAEAVLDGLTGLLVDPRAVSEVAGAVVRLLKAPERARTIGAEGRRWALENFTVEAMQRSLVDILSSVTRQSVSVGSPVPGNRPSVVCCQSCLSTLRVRSSDLRTTELGTTDI